MVPRAALGAVRAEAYRIPTDAPEADGTFASTATTPVVVAVEAGGQTGLSCTCTDRAAAHLVTGTLAQGRSRAWTRWTCLPPGRPCSGGVRNVGRDGLAATAISAVDAASWDLKGKLLGLPVAALLGRARDAVPIHGSGGFTTCSDE